MCCLFEILNNFCKGTIVNFTYSSYVNYFDVNSSISHGFTLYTAEAEKHLARREFGAIISNREHFLSIFCRIMAGTFTSKEARVTVEDKMITFLGRKDLLLDLKMAIEELRKLYKKVFDEKRNIVFTTVPLGHKWEEGCVLREYTNRSITIKKDLVGAITIEKDQVGEVRIGLSKWFRKYVGPYIEECSKLLHLSCKVSYVQQKIYWKETSKVCKLIGFFIEWNRTPPFVYQINPCSIPKRVVLQDVIREYQKSDTLCDVTLIGNEGGVIKAHGVALFPFVNEGVRTKLLAGQKKFRYLDSSAEMLQAEVTTAYQQLDQDTDIYFRCLYKEQLLCDFSFISKEGEEIKLHKLILHVYGGEVFRTALSGTMVESAEGSIRFPEVSQRALRRLVDYLYLGQQSLMPEKVLESVRYPVVDSRSVFRQFADIFSSTADTLEQQQARQQQLKTDIEFELCELIDIGTQWMIPGLVDCCTNIISVMPQPNVQVIKQLSGLYIDNQHLASISSRLENLKV